MGHFSTVHILKLYENVYYFGNFVLEILIFVFMKNKTINIGDLFQCLYISVTVIDIVCTYKSKIFIGIQLFCVLM